MEQLLRILKEYDDLILALMAALPRAHAFFAASQLLNSGVLPGAPRMAAIVSLLFFIVPMHLEWAQSFDRSPIGFAILFGAEYTIGFLLGAIASIVFWAMQAAGDFIDNQRGTAIASSVDPLRGEESSSLGNLLTLAFTTYIFVSGSILMLLGVLYQSFLIWPVGRSAPLLSEATPKFALALLDEGMKLMFMLAGPVVAIMFVAEFSLAIVSRFAPQVQVFVLAMPIKSLIGVATLVVYFKFLYPFTDRRLNDTPQISSRLYEIFHEGERLVAPRKDGAP